MAERRFTRLKASLSESAAKTRENVSRELRQSMTAPANNESLISFDYESCVRQLEDDFPFIAFPSDDIHCQSIPNKKTKTHDTSNEFNNSSFNSLFSRECFLHIHDKRHALSFNYAKQYFGSVFDSFLKSGSNEQIGVLRPHLFECDQLEESETEEEIVIKREDNCRINKLSGWLTIGHKRSPNGTAFLSFFKDRKKLELIWTQEVTSTVVKDNNNKSFKIDQLVIELGEELIDKWIEEINSLVVKNSFNAEEELTRILGITESELKEFRDENRMNLFSTYNELNVKKGNNIRLKEINYDFNYEKNIFKFLLNVEKCEFISANNRQQSSADSFLARISLFDSKLGKLSEEFRFASDVTQQTSRRSSRDSGRGFDELWPSSATKAVFCVDLSLSERNDLFLVLRIERSCCSRATQHWEPFCYSVRPLFTSNARELDLNSSFGLFYKQDVNRLSDEFIINAISNHATHRNNTVIGGKLLIKMSQYENEHVNTQSQLSSSLWPITPINSLLSPILHIQPLEPMTRPNSEFVNLLYIYPQSLKFDSQKVFSKARNILLRVELRDSDNDNASPIAAIFGRPNDKSMLVSSAVCAVSRHHVTPDFYEEIKIGLPLNLSEKLHVLFTFSHLSCKKECNKSPIGFAWLSLYKQIHVRQSTCLSVFASLPNGYLSCQSLGLGKGLSMPEVKFVGKDLFKVSLRLVSTVISRDISIQTTMNCVTRITCSHRNDSKEISKLISSERSLAKQLKQLLSCDEKELIRFSPIIFQQLLRLIVYSLNSELVSHALHTIVQLVDRIAQHEQLIPILHQFIEETFITCQLGDVLFHEQFLKSLNQLLEMMNKSEHDSHLALRHLWFLLKIHIKSCVQYLFESKNVQKVREERFTQLFYQQQRLLVETIASLIVVHSRVEESTSANRSLAHYITRCVSFADRSRLFNLFYFYINAFSSRDVLLNELRLNAIAIFCAHEHHIPLNNALMNDSFALSHAFCEKHFSVHVLLNEFKHSLSQTVRHVRHISLQILRNLLAKHSFDDRYCRSREIQTRVVSLYLPTIEIIIENINRIIESWSGSNHEITEEKSQFWSLSNHVPAAHVRHNSLPTRFDKFNSEEINDIVVCFVYIVSFLTEQQLNQLSVKQMKEVFVCLEIALYCFEYKPRKCVEMRSKTLPTHAMINNDSSHETLMSYLFQQNISIQISITTLQTINLYLCAREPKQLLEESPMTIRQILSLYLTLLRLPQSQSLLIHVFDNLRYLVLHFPPSLLFSSDTYLSQIISKIIHFCNSRLIAIRNNAIDLLYCLFGANFKRTRFEVIVCVSKLASSDSRDLSNFQSSLNRIELLSKSDPNYGQSEPSMAHIVERIRDILRATKQIREESRNHFENCELRLGLANSYSSTSRSLRRTWLENLSEVHARNNDWTEAAMCLCHVIAIVIEQLRLQGIDLIDGITHIRRVTDNIEEQLEESDWLEIEESHVTVASLESLISECVTALEKAELFELAPNVLKVLLSLYERDFQHQKCANNYTQIARMHSKALQMNESGKRIFNTYFRVAFYGSQNAEFIYKEPKVVSLAEMTSKMQKLYSSATFLTDSSNTESAKSDSTRLSIMITHVTPHVRNARNDFERNATNIRTFVYEQRLANNNAVTQSDAQSVSQQCKRRVILTSQKSFPFCLRRIAVIGREETILSPIEVAIDEMQARVQQLERVIQSRDAKHLQLILQGSVHVTVNCGPIAYANAFLQREDIEMDGHARQLRQTFEYFLELCEKALKLNEKLIKNNQIEYHLNLKSNFEKLKDELNLMSNGDKRTSVQIFDVISGTSVA